MIVLKLEMWPGGSEAGKYDLGRAYITNDGSSVNPKRGNYTAAIMRRGVTTPPHQGGATTRTVAVKDYPRLTYSVWVLIHRVLAEAFGPKKERGQ